MTIQDLKVLAPFRAEVLDVHFVVESNAASASGAARWPMTNFYQLILLDGSARRWAFAGANAAQPDIEALRRLEKGRTYTFPTAITKEGDGKTAR